MQISRLFETVYILLNRRHVTARELAERFEVSVRTVYRDIEALSQAGVPVYATQGAGGGIHISDAYVLNKAALTDMEQRQILLALQSLSATGHVQSDALLSRLGSLFDKDSADWIEVDFSRWGTAEQDRALMAAVKDAILRSRRISFAYYSYEGVGTSRTIEPVKLVYKSQAWYVQGFCLMRGAYRTFKLVRMSCVRVTEESFDRQSMPPLPSFEMPMNENAQEIPFVARFDASVAWRVLEEFSTPQITWEADGSMLVRACLQCGAGMDLSFFLSFGEQVQILEPEAVRQAMRERLEKTAQLYRKL